MADTQDQHKDGRTQVRTRYPGIFKVTYPSGTERYRAYVNVRGLGQLSKVCATLDEARAWQGRLRDPQERRSELRRQKSRTSVAEAVREFIDNNHKLKPSTRLNYEYVLGKYLTPDAARLYTWIGSVRLVDFETTDVERWVRLMIEDGVQPPTIQKAHRTLRAALSKAKRARLIPYNPASGVETPSAVEREHFPVTPDQLKAIAREMDERDRALLYTLVLTALRIGEVTSLRLRDLDLDTPALRVRENTPLVGGKREPGTPKSKRSSRGLYLSEFHAALLREHIERYAARSVDGTLDAEAFVFTSQRGKQVRHDNWRPGPFKEACRKAKVVRQGRDGTIETPTIHDLRHSTATWGAQAGFSLHEVKELLGHSNIAITSDTYTHLFPKHSKDLAEKLGSLLADPQPDGVVDIANRRLRSAGSDSP